MDFELVRGWDEQVPETWPVLIVGVLLFWLAVEFGLRRAMRLRLEKLEPRAGDVARAIDFLYQQYVAGLTNAEQLSALRSVTTDVSFWTANKAVCIEVAAGRYTEALSWRELCPDAPAVRDMELLLRVNEAEAMVNLGRVEESLAWIAHEPALDFVRAGMGCHRAWCFTILNRLDDAAASLAQTPAGDLGEQYESEWHLTAAALATSAADWSKAEAALKEAASLAVRASTKRNIDFARGMLLAAQSRHHDSLVHFERGASAQYTGQGGAALLAWGDSLKAVGREEEARRAWLLCAQRDPQSPAAARAQSRLADSSQIRAS
jgi:tetratricopeptide (TPR) repeat protein